MRFLAILSCALALPACQSTSAPQPIASDAAVGAPADTCRSQQYTTLVGRDKSEAPPATEGHPVRVVCSTCPMTMDYNAQRLNVIYDEKSGVVQSLSCG